MKREMRRSNMSLTPGGIAEMFLTDRETERIYLRQRKVTAAPTHCRRTDETRAAC
jgi:hypothetical protein